MWYLVVSYPLVQGDIAVISSGDEYEVMINVRLLLKELCTNEKQLGGKHISC